MFQYAYGQYLQSTGKKVKYILRRSKNPFGTYIDFPGVFNLPSNKKSQIYKPLIASSLRLSLKKVWAKFICKSYETGYYQNADFVKETSFSFNREILYKHTAAYDAIVNSETPVSIHIRGGDYRSEPQYSNISTAEYYLQAVKYIKKNVKHPHFFVFTNDIEYAKEILKNCDIKNLNFISEYRITDEFLSDPGYDLFLMTKCHHNIIANSTFSWWGATLNSRLEKIVVCPEHWINNSTEKDVIINKNWIKMPCQLKEE